MMKTKDFLHIFVSTGVLVYVCTDNVRVYTEKGHRPLLNFSVKLDVLKDITTFTITRYDKRKCMLVNYEYGQPLGSPILLNGCTMAPTANLPKGIMDIQLGAVEAGDQGMYELTEVSTNVTLMQSYTLYILGIPEPPTISASGTLYEGTSLTMACNSTSTTNPSNHSLTLRYTWTWSGSTITIGERFSFDTPAQRQLTMARLVRNDDRAVIGCTATEVRGKTSLVSVYTIIISYGPEKIRFNPPGSSHSYKDGEGFNPVTCLADCHPDCKFSWKKDSTSMSSTDVLDLDVVNSGKLGTYTCTATHNVPGHTLTKTLNVSVIYGPFSVALNPSRLSYTINEGDTLAPITCSADCFPACNIFWRRSSVSSVASDNAFLSIGELNRTDHGTYKCEATNPDTNKTSSQDVTVNVRYGPDGVTLNVPNIYTLTERDAVKTIDCSADCWPSCVFTWTNLTDNLPMRSSGVLVFGTAIRYDAGDYKCLARNSANKFSREAEKRFTFRVQYAPDVVISQSTTALLENTPLDLLCKASGVPAVYNFTGFVQRVGGVVVPKIYTDSPSVSGDSIYVNISSLQLQDTGDYTCYVHNGITGINKQLIQTASRKIEVLASPQFFLEETNFAGETSGNITIAIPFVSSPEYTAYSVLRYDGQPLSINEKYAFHIRNESVYPVFYGQQVTLSGNVLQIIISNLSEKEFGMYKIQITNKINTANVSIDVKAKSKPSPPTELNRTILDNTVTFEWKKGFNGGHEQTFVLQTSLNSDDSWTNKTKLNESESKYIKGNGRFQVHLTSLVPGIYSARLLSFNIIGYAVPVGFKDQFEIKELDEEKPASASGALIGGVAGGTLGVTVLVVVAVIIFRKKRKTQKDHDDSDRLTDGQKLANMSHHSEQEDNTIPDEVENPMYVSGDDVRIPKVTTADIYATPNKKKPKRNAGAGDIYAVVEKKRRNQDIDENSDNKQMKKGDTSAENNSKKKLHNKDVLVYADLVFANPPKGQKKLVIHGINDMTEYAQVDLTKRADPLPNSDDEHPTK